MHSVAHNFIILILRSHQTGQGPSQDAGKLQEELESVLHPIIKNMFSSIGVLENQSQGDIINGLNDQMIDING